LRTADFSLGEGAIAGLVFDLDGTLVDSRLDFAAMRAETGCPEGEGLLEYIERLPSASARDEAAAIVHSHEMAGARAATWMPGARALLASLSRRGLPMGIFTRNSREAATLVITALGMPCEDLVAREDARAKPDPEGILLLSRRWDLAPPQLLSVGDFRYDIEAAANAGARTCLYDPSGESLSRGEADLVVGHFDELAAILSGETVS
jgi:HAD superfamily hydrolase (TIGR01509 family)